MANTITKTTLLDGPRNLVQLINIAGEAAGTDETNTLLVDRSTFAPADGLELSVQRIEGLLTGFTAALSFDATADLVFVRLPDGDRFDYDWTLWGGVTSNKAGAGAIGDILITTTGLTVAADAGTFILHMRKQ